MTPAINEAKKRKISFKVHQYDHDPAHDSYGLEAAEKIGVSADRVFKTLVADSGNRTLVVGIIPVNSMMSMKHLAKAAGTKKSADGRQEPGSKNHRLCSWRGQPPGTKEKTRNPDRLISKEL